MIRRLLAIAWEMVPDVNTLVRGGIRAGVGLVLLYGATWFGPWAEAAAFGGKFFLMMSAITIIGHSEGVFVAHAADKMRVIGDHIWFGFLTLMAIAFLDTKSPGDVDDDY